MYGFQHLSQNSDSDSGRFSQGLDDPNDGLSSQISVTGWPQRFTQGNAGFRQPRNHAKQTLMTNKRFKFSRPAWSSNPAAPTKTISDNLIVAQQLQAKAETRDLQIALEAIVANVENFREECQDGFEKCAQISQSSMESVCSNAVSKISMRIEEFENAFSKLSERFDEKLNDLSSNDKMMDQLKMLSLVKDVKEALEAFNVEAFEERLNKLTCSIDAQFSSLKSSYETSVQAINESIHSVAAKVVLIQEILSQATHQEIESVNQPHVNDTSFSLLDENHFPKNETASYDPDLSTITLLPVPDFCTKHTSPPSEEALENRKKRALIEADAWDDEEDESDFEDPFLLSEP